MGCILCFLSELLKIAKIRRKRRRWEKRKKIRRRREKKKTLIQNSYTYIFFHYLFLCDVPSSIFLQNFLKSATLFKLPNPTHTCYVLDYDHDRDTEKLGNSGELLPKCIGSTPLSPEVILILFFFFFFSLLCGIINKWNCKILKAFSVIICYMFQKNIVKVNSTFHHHPSNALELH